MVTSLFNVLCQSPVTTRNQLRLLPSLLCNDVQSGILDMAYSVNIFIVYTIIR